MKNVSIMILMLMITFNYGCNEELVYNTVEENAPVVESFEPTTGSYKDEITIKGDYLGEVTAVYFGDSLTTIKYRVSNNELVAKLDKGSVSGNITVKNNVGTMVSTDQFTVIHPVPAITDFEDTQMLPNGIMKIEGTNLDVVYGVYFGTSKANVVEANDAFFLVEVPFFEEDEEPANVLLSYNDDGVIKQTQSTGKITLFRIFPEFTVIPDQGVTGTEIVFEGENLTLIDEILFNNESASIVSKTGEKLVVTLTEDQFAVTASGVTVKASYFGGTQVVTLHESFEVIVPTVDYYANITLKPRGAEGEYFLDFNTGLVYDACADWLTVLQPNISLLAYASKSGYIQLRQAGNAGSVIKNYKCDGVNLPTENCVKVSKMGVLDPSNADHKMYIDAVKDKTLNNIDSDVVANFGASSSDLKIYTTGTGNEDKFGAGDVIVFKQTWNDVEKYGFIEIIEAVADVPENIGQASGDGSYFKFNYYFQK
ncbi:MULTISPECIES: IPT/TIG domain-containing protein [unclassified Saccharicrinis]|uniref:IPT/TIG domain-containing protein n=1 Tax=unclassified Saccharicrinis TaxID=2646859 RepID=UPI003D355DA0